MKSSRIYPPTYALIALLGMLALHFVVPVAVFIPPPWSLLGIIPLVLGVVVSMIAEGAFRKVGTTVRPYEISAVLVTRGLYRISRNPMYAGIVLALTGVAIILGTLSPFLVAVGFAAFIDRKFIRVEEQMLVRRFGDEWRAYAARTRRWL